MFLDIIHWVQLSRVYLKTKTESNFQSPKRRFKKQYDVLNKNRTMDNVQKQTNVIKLRFRKLYIYILVALVLYQNKNYTFFNSHSGG
jgi:hypothetical protein